MQYGDAQLYACPRCGALVKWRGVKSGNTFGSKLYSDGKRESPMLPQISDLVKCESCSAFYWLREQDPKDPMMVWEQVGSARAVKPISIEELGEAIDQDIARDRYRELRLRRMFLYALNDRTRTSGLLPYGSGVDEHAWWRNVEALLALLDDNDTNERFLKAELLRYKGDFDGCMELLSGISEPKFDRIKEAFKEACAAESRMVFKLP